LLQFRKSQLREGPWTTLARFATKS
jgi:hypothetical protein